MSEGSHDPPHRPRFSKPVPRHGRPRSSRQHEQLPSEQRQPLPDPTGQPPYRLSLERILGAEAVAEIESHGRLILHLDGDTGGVKSPEPQQIVADHMDADFSHADPTSNPAFFYHVGDVVYFYGEASNYYEQFYEPYHHYDAPIFAIPGNHDGAVHDPGVESLDAFVRNFCAPSPTPTPESQDSGRPAMIQPNVYWTLEAPFLTVIGLYTNVPEGGWVSPEQEAWFQSELRAAPTNKALFVALHHPAYSLDSHHSGSEAMITLLDESFAAANRLPDAVFTGHVHNYQRFTRHLEGREIPYIVAGAGGYWHLHSMLKEWGQPITIPYTPFDHPDVTLEQYVDDRHGFLRLQVSPRLVRGQYLTVPRPQESWHAPAHVADAFTLDLDSHRLFE